jgi:hypothetical protein
MAAFRQLPGENHMPIQDCSGGVRDRVLLVIPLG